MSASVVAHAEADDANPRWDLVQLLLGATDHDLRLAKPAVLPARAEQWLALSTSARLYRAMGGRMHHRYDRQHPGWTELGRVAAGRCVVLGPALSTGIWIPDHAVDVPQVGCVTDADVWGRPLPPIRHLDLVVGPIATTGTIPVGVTFRSEVLAHPPDAPLLHHDPTTSRALSAVAALLAERERRDRQGRRSAAHKDSRTRREFDFVMARRKWGGLPEPDPRERRDWRLGGEASFREWMLRRGYPLPEDVDDEEEGV